MPDLSLRDANSLMAKVLGAGFNPSALSYNGDLGPSVSDGMTPDQPSMPDTTAQGRQPRPDNPETRLPSAAFTSPADSSASILRQGTASGAGGADAIELARLRDERKGELEDRLANDLRAGDPSSRHDALTSRYQLGNLTRDIQTDPFTGDAAHAETDRLRSVLGNAALEQRPEVGDLATTLAKRNAFAQFLQKIGGYQADVSGPGEQALNEASKRKIAEIGATAGAKPLDATTNNSVIALHQAVDLGSKLYQKLQDRIASHPELQMSPDEARQRGILSQAKDVGMSQAKRWLYGQGILQAPEGYDESVQLEEWMKVLASRGLMGGMRNMQWLNQIQDHLTQGRLPDAANMARLETFLKNAPDLEKDAYDVRNKQRLPSFTPRGQAEAAVGADQAAQPGLGSIAQMLSDAQDAYAARH